MWNPSKTTRHSSGAIANGVPGFMQKAKAAFTCARDVEEEELGTRCFVMLGWEGVETEIMSA